MTDADRALPDRLQSLFHQAVDLPEAQRTAFAAEACGSDRNLRRHLLELLAAHDAAGDLLERPPVQPDAVSDAPDEIPTEIPARIGRYDIKGVIAAGGMGVVYLAEQHHPTRTVAVKVLRRGLTSQDARRRFQHEVEILAQLQHPGVASIYEAGLYEEDGCGLPFFAMEYIAEARSITRYATDEHLGIRARIELFALACEGVASGHQRGIIHRDLKPENMLVDQKGQVRIIDFGIARSTDGDLAITTMKTDVGQLLGTLQYMSPEQCGDDPAALDLRSDVYALGVVLYELLAERLPYDVQNLFLAEAARMVTEQPPPGINTLNPRLGEELATIVHMALDKDPARRYRTAGDLADDLRRFLTGDAILARRPSMIYHLRVLSRRHKALTAASIATFLTLGVGILGTGFGLNRARQERDRALEALAFGLDIIESVSAALAQGERIPVSVVASASGWLDQGACRDQPGLEASFQATVGRAYTSLGRGNLAAPHLRAALELERRLSGPASAKVAEILTDLSQALALTSGESEGLAREALGLRRQLLGPQHPDTLRSIDVLSGLLMDRGEYEEAERLIRETLHTRRRVLGEAHPAVARSLQSLGFCRFDANDYATGEPLLRQAMELQRRLLPPTHLDLAQTAYSLAQLCQGKGAFAEAESLLRETRTILDMRLVEDHYWSRNVKLRLADVLLAQGKAEDAATWYRQFVDLPSTGDVKPGFKEALARAGWGECLTRMGRFPEAEAQLLLAERLSTEETVRLQQRLDWRIVGRQASLYTLWGRTSEATRRLAESEQLLREGIEAAEDEYWAALTQADLGACLMRMGRYREAERELLDAYARFAEASDEAHPEIWKIINPLVELYQDWNRLDQAAIWQARDPSDQGL